jgi:hypothetical protein
MHKTPCLAGIFAVSAGLLAGGVPAFADSVDNDGINAGNDNNLSLLPIQLCGNNIAVIGGVVSVLSPQANGCNNAPIIDHPIGGYPGITLPPKPTDPCDEWKLCGDIKPCDDVKPCDYFDPCDVHKPFGHDHEPFLHGHEPFGHGHGHGHEPFGHGHGHGQPCGEGPGGAVSAAQPGAARAVPTAPAPVAVRGHHAVTG